MTALPMTGASLKCYCKIVKADTKAIIVDNETQPLPLGDGRKKFITIPRDRVLAFSKSDGWVKLPAEVAKLLGLA